MDSFLILLNACLKFKELLINNLSLDYLSINYFKYYIAKLVSIINKSTHHMNVLKKDNKSYLIKIGKNTYFTQQWYNFLEVWKNYKLFKISFQFIILNFVLKARLKVWPMLLTLLKNSKHSPSKTQKILKTPTTNFSNI